MPITRKLSNRIKKTISRCQQEYNRDVAAAAKLLQLCLTLCDPIDGSPPGSPCPWDSPGKNTGVGCHFLLQCMKVKSESEVSQLCLTLSDPMDCSPPGSSVHGIFQARVLEWGAIAFSRNRDILLLLELSSHENQLFCYGFPRLGLLFQYIFLLFWYCIILIKFLLIKMLQIAITNMLERYEKNFIKELEILGKEIEHIKQYQMATLELKKYTN